MYLGIDIGTSGVKTVLMDETGAVLGSASSALTVERPRPAWSEQDPESWWRAVVGTLDELTSSHSSAMARVEGIGLSGQMHGATLLDEAHRVLRPAILWNDGRSEAECAALDARADFRGIGGNLVMPGFTAPKLEWVARHEPEVFEKTRLVLLPKDYVRLRLTGEAVSDMSDAAGTLWLDVARRDWSDALLAATGLDRSQMPRLAEGSDATGRVKADLAGRWGFAAAPVVAGGAGDNAASACGIGAVRPGEAFISLGTSGVLFVATDRFRPNTQGAVHAFCHALPETWHQMGVILSATDSLNWLARVSGCDVATLEAEASVRFDERHGPSEVVFLPYLSGERTPHNDAGARGSFIGLSHANDRADLALAVLEGVAFAFRDSLDVLSAAGSSVARATAIGGGARSECWLKILAAVLGIPIDVPQHGDFGAAFGAARLGRAAAVGRHDASLFPSPETDFTMEPDAGLAASYREGLGRYRALYPALKEVLR
ncbi:xylulokinase [Stappia sp.]|uniref:xylulokinase n=1 Tax=Stappia sp. TaxID=1870903 RepID=UPI003D111A2E